MLVDEIWLDIPALPLVDAQGKGLLPADWRKRPSVPLSKALAEHPVGEWLIAHGVSIEIGDVEVMRSIRGLCMADLCKTSPVSVIKAVMGEKGSVGIDGALALMDRALAHPSIPAELLALAGDALHLGDESSGTAKAYVLAACRAWGAEQVAATDRNLAFFIAAWMGWAAIGEKGAAILATAPPDPKNEGVWRDLLPPPAVWWGWLEAKLEEAYSLVEQGAMVIPPELLEELVIFVAGSPPSDSRAYKLGRLLWHPQMPESRRRELIALISPYVGEVKAPDSSYATLYAWQREAREKARVEIEAEAVSIFARRRPPRRSFGDAVNASIKALAERRVLQPRQVAVDVPGDIHIRRVAKHAADVGLLEKVAEAARWERFQPKGSSAWVGKDRGRIHYLVAECLLANPATPKEERGWLETASRAVHAAAEARQAAIRRARGHGHTPIDWAVLDRGQHTHDREALRKQHQWTADTWEGRWPEEKL